MNLCRVKLYQFKDGKYGVKAYLFGFLPVGFLDLLGRGEIYDDQFSINLMCKSNKAEAEGMVIYYKE